MSYGRGSSIGRGYGPPTSGPYYAQQGGGPPPRHSQPSGYMSHSDFEPSPPPAMRGGPGPVPHFEADPARRGGAYGRGYGAPLPQAPPPVHPPRPDYPSRGAGLDHEPGSASGFESGSNSDAPPPSSSGGGQTFANDCEIVVLHKSQQQYGEMIERELRKKGLQVDIMFPRGEVKVQEFLKPIAKLGTIFAVVIDVDNEQARTVNFYQFRGHTKPQYHKNVPLLMAYNLIIQIYNELKQKEIGVIPDQIKNILKKLMDEKTLKDDEYTAVVRFLQERRKRQNAFLNRTSNVIQEHSSDVQSLIDTAEGRELKTRILTIMNENTG